MFTARDLRPLGPAFAAHDGSVSSVDASPDGRTLVSAGSDGQIRLWDVATRRPIGSPLPGPENINAVAFFAPGGAYVFAVFRDGRGDRWDVRERAWERKACSIAGRRLTPTEWHEALPGRAYAPACWARSAPTSCGGFTADALHCRLGPRRIARHLGGGMSDRSPLPPSSEDSIDQPPYVGMSTAGSQR